jgi:octaprenyl-diphosphate synthase
LIDARFVGRSKRGDEVMAVLENLSTVTARHGVDDLTVRLVELRDWLADDLAALETEVVETVTSDTRGDLADRAAAWLLVRPGKRIRPLCVMLAARIGGRAFDRTVKDFAVAAELVHAATLLHDDVIDDGAERRGAPTARVLFGNSASILGGDHLLTEALRRVARTGAHGALVQLLDVISEMVHAEAMQLERRGRFVADRDAYLRVIHGKTAALFRWGLVAGGAAAGLEPPQLEALGRAGVALGLAFQLVDDAIDLEVDASVSGKTPLADLREGKLTWPLVVASERDPALSAVIAARITEGGNGTQDALEPVLVQRIRATGAIEATRDFAAEQAGVARSALLTLPEGSARSALLTVVETALERTK